ncbi:DUF3331 domain-containing protein [Burkholderia plantarii]|uniref:DUF3331 domain-containing protein n=1 Tax=Burkholderia plantarii TaxID=41899 RepID=UPI000706EB81|nr:DUF3331 domain-containing protein [Burkholderia plantarii]ALK32472.1 hypothetical protein bpln_2g01940 [Burkholderia plantarii]
MQNNRHFQAREQPRSTSAIWDHVMRNLLGLPRQVFDDDTQKNDASSRHARVRVLERVSANTIVVLWQDATRCHYSDQTWIRCMTRVRGVCALRGEIIRRGDVVYKPQALRRTVANGQAMILASEVAYELAELGSDEVSASISSQSAERNSNGGGHGVRHQIRRFT